MSTLIKQGVFGNLSREASNARRKIERMAANKNEDMIITSIQDGTHTPGSLHAQGDAFDMRKLSKVSIAEIKKVVGVDIDVINENDHWHVEYDKKAKQ